MVYKRRRILLRITAFFISFELIMTEIPLLSVFLMNLIVPKELKTTRKEGVFNKVEHCALVSRAFVGI